MRKAHLIPTAFLVLALTVAAPTVALGQEGEETAGNNLSYPVIFLGSPMALRGTALTPSLLGGFGVTWSYGCALPAAEGETDFPNTSCITPSEDGTTFTVMGYEACAAVCTTATATYPVERIYWQKTTDTWQAGSLYDAATATAAYFDWSDNLESVAWSASSVIRVESIPFASLATTPLTGYGMWHVFSQGPDEVWGLHTTDADSPVPYSYDGAYATVQGPNARLTFTKLEAGTSEQTPVPPTYTYTWDGVSGEWDGAPFNSVTAANAELNVTGKVIFGFNWNMKRFTVTGGVEKAGWWRLTFSTTDDSILFTSSTVATAPPPDIPTVPEVITSFRGELERTLGAVAGDVTILADTGPLFTPVIDVANNISYIDIYIKAAKGGGRRPR